MSESKTEILKFYKNINKLDKQIVQLKKTEELLTKKLSKTGDSKRGNHYLSLIEETLENIRIFEKKKIMMLQVMATLTPMVEINVLEDPYIEDIVADTKKQEIASNYLYGCLSYGYTIFSNKKIPNITQKMSLEEFETKEASKNIKKK